MEKYLPKVIHKGYESCEKNYELVDRMRNLRRIQSVSRYSIKLDFDRNPLSITMIISKNISFNVRKNILFA